MSTSPSLRKKGVEMDQNKQRLVPPQVQVRRNLQHHRQFTRHQHRLLMVVAMEGARRERKEERQTRLPVWRLPHLAAGMTAMVMVTVMVAVLLVCPPRERLVTLGHGRGRRNGESRIRSRSYSPKRLINTSRPSRQTLPTLTAGEQGKETRRR